MNTSSPESEDEGKTSKQRKNHERKPRGKACLGNYKLLSLTAALHARRQRMNGKGWPGRSAVTARWRLFHATQSTWVFSCRPCRFGWTRKITIIEISGCKALRRVLSSRSYSFRIILTLLIFLFIWGHSFIDVEDYFFLFLKWILCNAAHYS